MVQDEGGSGEEVGEVREPSLLELHPRLLELDKRWPLPEGCASAGSKQDEEVEEPFKEKGL
eukprot:8489013-Alexandrium_andersonii.AAC.1